jgi:hypothetical protein
MSTTLSIPRRVSSRRTQVLAGASALAAAASVTVTLALAGGGDDAVVQPSPGQPSIAQPAQSGGPSAAERFHHFRGQPSVAQPEQAGGASGAERFHHFR